MTDTIRHITDGEFNDVVIKSDRPVLVDFWAEWCGPCHAIGPILEELAEDMADAVSVVKVNVDENQEITGAMGIRSIPTLIVFKDGKAVAQQAGAAGLSQLKEFVSGAI